MVLWLKLTVACMGESKLERERRGIETIVKRYKEHVFVVSYLVVWPNISTEIGRVVDTTSSNFSFSWRC